MMDEKKIAFGLKIESQSDKKGHVAIKAVADMFYAISESFKNYRAIKFRKNPRYLEIYEKNKSVLNYYLDSSELYIIDANHGGFETLIGYRALDFEPGLFENEIQAQKIEVMADYKEHVLGQDLNSIDAVQYFADNYSPLDRHNIFGPLFAKLDQYQNEYNVGILINGSKTNLVIPKSKKFYNPKLKKEVSERNKLLMMYVKADEHGNFNKKNILYAEEVMGEIYPYKPESIKHKHLIFELKAPMTCNVRMTNTGYEVSHEGLKIVAIGQTREEATTAFNEAFFDIYSQVHDKPDSKLKANEKSQKGLLNELLENIFESRK